MTTAEREYQDSKDAAEQIVRLEAFIRNSPNDASREMFAKLNETIDELTTNSYPYPYPTNWPFEKVAR